MPKVSVIIPVYNVEQYLRECLDSVVNQTLKEIEIICVDDGSIDNTRNILLEYAKKDSRIKFVGTVYDQELLMKIRENAYAYLHGHEVGGTNPSLLEALSSTDLNLLLDVGFNREVAEEAALYWSKEKGELTSLISKADDISLEVSKQYGKRANTKIAKFYSWPYITQKYLDVFMKGN